MHAVDDVCHGKSVNGESQFAQGLVSIVLPCYGGERHLSAAIVSCLAQSYQNFELIVVNDASPDRCLEIAKQFAAVDSRIRIINRAENGGVARAFNSGFEVARGEFHTRLAQDDLFEPDGVERLVATIRNADSRIGLVYGDSFVIDEGGRQTGRDVSPGPADVLRFRNRLGLAVMWKRDVWECIGQFDPECDAAEDFDYWLRVAARYDLAKCEGLPVIRVRFHPEMGSVRHGKRQVLSTFRAIRKRFGSRWRFGVGWQRRQVALGCARMTAAYIHVDRRQYWSALAQVLLSFAEWPAPFPTRAYDVSCVRGRAIGGIMRAVLKRLPLPKWVSPVTS